MGSRKYDFTKEICDIICDRLIEGESLRSICRDPEMPAASTVLKWLIAHPEFALQYARAREAQAEGMVDEMLDIADDAQNDWMEKRGLQVPDNEAIQRSKLRVDTRRWIASKMRPKKYGDAVGREPVPENTKEQVIRVIGGFPEAFEKKE